MANFESINYSTSFLDQVIVRSDFLEFVPTNSIFDLDLEKVILQKFPRRGKDQIIRFNSINVVIDALNQQTADTTREFTEGIQREYSSLDGQNKIILSNKFLVFEINRYKSFEELMGFVRPILLAIYANNTITASRTGIRYINIYDADKIKLQKNYFSQEVASSLYAKNTVDDNINLIRSMSMSEYRIGSMSLNFRFGMYNPEYPNNLKKNSFALDFDCFTEEPVDTMDGVLRCIENGHRAIQTLFENAITDNMRKVMQNE